MEAAAARARFLAHAHMIPVKLNTNAVQYPSKTTGHCGTNSWPIITMVDSKFTLYSCANALRNDYDILLGGNRDVH